MLPYILAIAGCFALLGLYLAWLWFCFDCGSCENSEPIEQARQQRAEGDWASVSFDFLETPHARSNER